MIEIVKMLRSRVCTSPCPAMTFEAQCDCALDVFAANRIEELEKMKNSVRVARLEKALQTIAQYDTQSVALNALYPDERKGKR